MVFPASMVAASQSSSSSSSSSSHSALVSSAMNELLLQSQDALQQQHDSFLRNNYDEVERILANNNDEKSWLDDYSLKFLGCYAETNQARFRLCPKGKCWARDYLGCREAYGDYAISMDSYVQGLMKLWDGVTWSTCNQTAYEECGDCYNMTHYNNGNANDYDDAAAAAEENGDDAAAYGDDDAAAAAAAYDDDDAGNGYDSVEECLYACLQNTELPSCYYVLNEDDYFLERYACGKLEETGYYLGPYCGQDGSGIYIGLFQDEDCTQMVDDGSLGGVDTWKEVAGDKIAFTEKSHQSLQFNECLRCENLSIDYGYDDYKDDDDGNNGNDNGPEGTTCDQLYNDDSLLACETYLSSPYKTNNPEANIYSEAFNEQCFEIDQIPLPSYREDHSPFYYFGHFALPILIALALLIASQRRNQYDRAQYDDKKETLVGVHGEQSRPTKGVFS